MFPQSLFIDRMIIQQENKIRADLEDFSSAAEI